MVPAWMFFGQTALLILALAGWGNTIRKSMSRGLSTYELGQAAERRRQASKRQTRRAGRLSKRWHR